jgi:hypothetical protein
MCSGVVLQTVSGFLYVLNSAAFSISSKSSFKKSLAQLSLWKKKHSLSTVPKLNCFS